MQCPNCHFENMPGSAGCGRCGTSLQLTSATIAVHPPRASVWMKRLRRWLPLGRQYYSFRGVLMAPLKTFGPSIEGIALRDLSIATLLRMLIPGWVQIHEGLLTRGRLFLVAWIVPLLGSVLFIGSTIGATLFGLALAVHTASILDRLFGAYEAVLTQRIIACIVTLIVVSTLYLTCISFGSRWIAVRVFTAPIGDFSTGDVVVYGPNAYQSANPIVGDVVLYRNRPYTTGGQGERAIRINYNGQWINRIVAGPGSLVTWNKGELQVNGERSTHLPLNAPLLPKQLELRVPGDCYCILPTTILNVSPSDENAWQVLSLVGRGDIEGKAYLRNYPFYRWWWID
jgi:hypothetical protein